MNESLMPFSPSSADKEDTHLLASGKNLAQDLTAQENLVRRILPHDVRNEILAQLQAEEHHLSPLQWLLTVLTLALTLFLAWRYLPTPVDPIIIPSDTVIILPPPPPDSKYKELDEHSEVLEAKTLYVECAQYMDSGKQPDKEPVLSLPQLMLEPDDIIRKHAGLLYRYLNVVRLGNVDDELKMKAIGYGDKIIKLCPDEPKWMPLILEIDLDHLLNADKIYMKLKGKQYGTAHLLKDIRSLSDNLQQIERQCEKLERQVSAAAGHTDDKFKETYENLVAYKYLQARLLISLWLLKGGSGTDNFPDTEGDIGVADREAALLICLEDENPDTPLGKMRIPHREFYELRQFIAKVILQQNPWWSTYYWKGETHWKSKELEQEFKYTQDKLLKANQREVR